jgi:hypothetical protein
MQVILPIYFLNNSDIFFFIFFYQQGPIPFYFLHIVWLQYKLFDLKNWLVFDHEQLFSLK